MSIVTYPTTENRFHDSGKNSADKGLQLMKWASLNFAPSLVAYWRLDVAGATWPDSGPNGYTLNRTGTVNTVTGKVGAGAANFVGNAANFLSNGNLIVPVNTPWSISCWVKIHSLAVESHLFGNGVSGAQSGWRLMYLSGPRTFALSSMNSDSFAEERCVSATVIAAESWYHVVATVDASQNARIYVNGVVTFDEHQWFSDPSESFVIGNDGDVDFPASAAIDSVALWSNRVISQAEVYALYNNGDGRSIL